MTPKAEVIEMIRNMADDMTLADIIKAIKVRFQIEDGLQEPDDGLGIPDEEVKRGDAKWQN